MVAPKRTRRCRAAIPEDPRQRLLAVALDLFAHHSFEGVSTNRVARAPGVSQPIIYYHSRPKDQLWQEAVTGLMRDLGTRFPRNRTHLKDLARWRN